MHLARKFAVAAILVFGLQPAQADAGCGCEKPPPPLAAIRPAFASPGNKVVLFAPGIVAGDSYSVTFYSAVEATVQGRAKFRRDLADGVHKPQLAVSVPDLPLGPTSVTVRDGDTVVLEIEEHQFTVLQEPIPLPEANLDLMATCYSAAVGADSTVYVPVDVSAIDERMIFFGRADGYRLTFGDEDIQIYNTQGVLMQRLGPEQPEIYAIYDEEEGSSFTLAYDRHEFQTYRALHVDDENYAADPSDQEWHVNGSRHTDHDNLVIAISGLVGGEDLPAAGQTPQFTFRISTWPADAADAAPVQPTIVQDNCSGDETPGDQLRRGKRRDGGRGEGKGRGRHPERDDGDPAVPLGETAGDGGSNEDDGGSSGAEHDGDSGTGSDDPGNADQGDHGGDGGAVLEGDGDDGTPQEDEGDDGSVQANGGGDGTTQDDDGDGTNEPAGSLCETTPLTGCRVPIQPGKAQLSLKDKSPDSRDGLVWKWVKGEQTAPGDFDSLMTTDSLALCMYDESGDSPILVFDATVPPDGTCSSGSAGKPCWRGVGKRSEGYGQYKYRNRNRTPDGIEQMVLKSGGEGKASLIVKGKGENLDMPELPLGLPLRVQLQARTGSCWEATYSEVGLRDNSSELFTGRAD